MSTESDPIKREAMRIAVELKINLPGITKGTPDHATELVKSAEIIETYLRRS